MDSYDFIIIGSGVAGLSAALAAQANGRVLLLTKASLGEANTRYAQGGIAAALAEDDTTEAHRLDTVAAGAGLVDEAAAALLTAEAPMRIADLAALGVPFDRRDGRIALGREAAHSAARVVHAGGDATGDRLERTLVDRLLATGVAVREQTPVTEILVEGGRVQGVTVLDLVTGNRVTVESRVVILATGGAGRLYRYTTNPAVATGDGVALAYRAGAEVMDMEFIQFHPTALRLPGAPTFLITEAARGEGGVLRDSCGRAFMAAYDPRAELAPRDVVARAIHAEMSTSGADHVLLDLTHLPPERLHARFPQIDAFCRAHGLDMACEPLPVAPAAHYVMGGVRTDLWGQTNIGGLFACGEVACTGVHGANRLASNSLLEGLVFARRAVERAASHLPPAATSVGALALSPPTEAAETPPPTLAALQSLMWQEAGIVRDAAGLGHARAVLSAWQAVAGAGCPVAAVESTQLELESLILVGRMVVEAALRREESRGAHFRSDVPDTDPAWQRHLVFRKDGRAG